ncbi:MAG: beta-L-arabinofuranosidase domain-containing protein [Tepidisphaeraceae bacterium]
MPQRVIAAAGGLLMGTSTFAVEPAKTVVPPAVPFAAESLPLTAVRLTGGPLKHAQDLDREYLLRLEPDRMLAYFRERAGLARKAEPYGGWDGAGRQLTGHIAGHYLSAVSLMYAATGDERFKQRADYIVAQLKEVQDARGDGYVGALLGDADRRGNAAISVHDGKPLLDGDILFKRIADGYIHSGGFDLNGMWSPWYVQHKLYAVLRDAYRYTGNATALEVEKKFAGWCDSIVGKLTDAQAQKMLDTEFGGMNEVLVDLYADTGDKRWLTLSGKFDHKAIIDPLAEGKDLLAGKHGNTQIPKVLGSLAEYLYTGNAAAGKAADTFWDAVALHHSFATGGHGYDEYFGKPDRLSGQVDGTGQRSRDMRTAESCNVYNMLKMTRRLFSLRPDVKYADFQERALYNHVLASINGQDGRMCYMVPVGPGVVHEYQGMFSDFTCCVGTGMENHALHGDGLYYATNDRLYVSVYAPSTAEWAAAEVSIRTETDMPIGESATLHIATKTPKVLTLSLRRPQWAGEGFAVSVNGQPVNDLGRPDTFVDIRRTWSDGDTVVVTLPHTLRAEALADNPHRVALMWGPVVLAGDFGGQATDDQAVNAAATPMEFPVFAQADRPLADWITPVAGKPGTFTATTADGLTRTLMPFYTVGDRRYGLYWDLFTPKQWADRQAEYKAEQDRRKRFAEATIAFVQIGEMQPERDFNFQGDNSIAIRTDGQPGRSGGRWMSFDVPTHRGGPVALSLTTLADMNEPIFVSVDGRDLGPGTLRREGTSRFAEVIYTVPADVSDKAKMTVQLSVPAGKELPAIFGLRVLRADVLQP